MFTFSKKRDSKTLLNHGKCYLTGDTAADDPSPIYKTGSNLLNKNNQHVINMDENTFRYSMAEQGISVHITDHETSILVGAPGVDTWKGSVVVLSRPAPIITNATAQRRRRSTDEDRFAEHIEYVLEPSHWNQEENSYFGYAVSSGYFNTTSDIMFVASAPRAGLSQGEVYLFTMSNADDGKANITIWQTLSGTQIGEYFGYALASEDFDNDGFSDLAVGAPFHSFRDETKYDQGAVYVFRNSRGTILKQVSKLVSGFSGNGRFGTTLSPIGDLNGDTYNGEKYIIQHNHTCFNNMFKDLAVGAPFEDHGAVYIFLGGPNGLSEKASQRLTPENGVGMMMFGHGISKGFDIDGNGIPDLAVGAPNAEITYVYFAYPVASVTATITTFPGKIKPEASKFKINACWQLNTTSSTTETSNVFLTMTFVSSVSIASITFFL